MTDGHPTIYLAGPVGAESDGGAGWRNAISKEFAGRIETKNPLAKYNVRLEDLEVVPGTSDPDREDTVGVDEIVESDKAMIDASDAVLVGYSCVHSIGTPMEVMYAHQHGLPVAVWIRDETPVDHLSPWYRYHSTVMTTDVKAAIAHLERTTATMREVSNLEDEQEVHPDD